MKFFRRFPYKVNTLDGDSIIVRQTDGSQIEVELCGIDAPKESELGLVRDLPPQHLRFPKSFSPREGIWSMETELLNAIARAVLYCTVETGFLTALNGESYNSSWQQSEFWHGSLLDLSLI